MSNYTTTQMSADHNIPAAALDSDHMPVGVFGDGTMEQRQKICLPARRGLARFVSCTEDHWCFEEPSDYGRGVPRDWIMTRELGQICRDIVMLHGRKRERYSELTRLVAVVATHAGAAYDTPDYPQRARDVLATPGARAKQDAVLDLCDEWARYGWRAHPQGMNVLGNYWISVREGIGHKPRPRIPQFCEGLRMG